MNINFLPSNFPSFFLIFLVCLAISLQSILNLELEVTVRFYVFLIILEQSLYSKLFECDFVKILVKNDLILSFEMALRLDLLKLIL